MFKSSKHLIQVARQVMKTVFVVMLLQSITPAFITILDAQTNKDELVYTIQHNLLVVPQLLKEKEEDEVEIHNSVWGGSPVELLDLSVHASSLNDAHTSPQFFISGLYHPVLSSHLFTLHHSLLI
jgi:hypothetical protein